MIWLWLILLLQCFIFNHLFSMFTYVHFLYAIFVMVMIYLRINLKLNLLFFFHHLSIGSTYELCLAAVVLAGCWTSFKFPEASVLLLRVQCELVNRDERGEKDLWGCQREYLSHQNTTDRRGGPIQRFWTLERDRDVVYIGSCRLTRGFGLAREGGRHRQPPSQNRQHARNGIEPLEGAKLATINGRWLSISW
jgi:hypothetical protein